MEKTTDLELKYQKLATEYSKVRSQATVLKKAVLDEQAKSNEMKETVKKHEQQIRKHDQEMESLTFRNEQLTKRITVLQNELHINSNGGHGTKKGGKGGKGAVAEHSSTVTGVLDEELQKKIFENAQLVSTMADREFELNDCKEKIDWLENKLVIVEKQLHNNNAKYFEEIENLKRQKSIAETKCAEIKNHNTDSDCQNDINVEQMRHWKEQCERWKTECDLLRSKPTSNHQLTDYYESQLSEIIEAKQLAQSESKSLCAENVALYCRIENLLLENKQLMNQLEKSNEELVVTNKNYKSQLDAMTEHLAAQNEKITKQCDEIQGLKHKLSLGINKK